MDAPFAEDSYGRVKRLTFVAALMDSDGLSVLDVGCGTGSQLTRPLAEIFPSAHILGIDSDRASLAAARGAGGPPSLNYAQSDDLDPGKRFDRVIASEVIEHVEDPHGFLLWLRDRAAPGGRILITVPNGYGAAELSQAVEALAILSGIWSFIRRIKRRIFGQPAEDATALSDSHAVSPHVNFFTRRDLLDLFAAAGLEVRRFAPRTFLCGFLLDQIVSALNLADWNARVADRLPAALASDWMFELSIAGPPRPSPWRRSALARARRALNRRRWGLSA